MTACIHCHARLRACVPACLRACVPACLLHVCMHAAHMFAGMLPVCMHACMHAACMHACLLHTICMQACTLARLRACMLACLHAASTPRSCFVYAAGLWCRCVRAQGCGSAASARRAVGRQVKILFGLQYCHYNGSILAIILLL